MLKQWARIVALGTASTLAMGLGAGSLQAYQEKPQREGEAEREGGDRPREREAGERERGEPERGPRESAERERGPRDSPERDRGPRESAERDRGARPDGPRDGDRRPGGGPRDGERPPFARREGDRPGLSVDEQRRMMTMLLQLQREVHMLREEVHGRRGPNPEGSRRANQDRAQVGSLAPDYRPGRGEDRPAIAEVDLPDAVIPADPTFEPGQRPSLDRPRPNPAAAEAEVRELRALVQKLNLRIEELQRKQGGERINNGREADKPLPRDKRPEPRATEERKPE